MRTGVCGREYIDSESILTSVAMRGQVTIVCPARSLPGFCSFFFFLLYFLLFSYTALSGGVERRRGRRRRNYLGM